MRPKPDVDAVDMEGVAADRKRTDVVVFFEFQQADGAIMAAAFPRVDGQRYGFDDRFVEAVRGEYTERLRGVKHVRRRLDVPGGGRLNVAAATPPPTPVATVGVDESAGEEARVGDYHEGSCDYHHHGYQRRTEIDTQF